MVVSGWGINIEDMIKFKSIISVIVLILLGTSCVKKESGSVRTFSKKEFSSTIRKNVNDSIVVKRVFNIVGWKVLPHSIALFSVDDQDNDVLYEYSDTTSELIQSGINIGNGPDEYVSFNSGETNISNNVLSYDIMRRVLYTYDLTSVPFKVNAEFELPVDEDGLTNPYTFITQVDNDTFLMKLDSPSKSAWHFVDLKDKKILWEYENPIRDKEYSYTPFDLIQSVYDSKLFVAYKYIDLIEIYNITKDGISLIKSYGDTQDQSKIEDYNKLEYKYLSVAYDGDNFYCLKSTDGSETGNIIETYNIKNDTPVNMYVLDKDIYSISFDIEKHRLIGYSQDQDATVFYIWNM